MPQTFPWVSKGNIQQGTYLFRYVQFAISIVLFLRACVVLLCLNRGGPDVQPDERIAAGYEIMSSPLSHVCSTLYPSVYPLGHMKGGWPKAGNGKVGSHN